MSSSKTRVLFSYAYLRGAPFFAEMVMALADAGVLEILIDSGAFTDHSQNLKKLAKGKRHLAIQMDDYVAFVRRYRGLIWNWFSLDVIGDPETTLKNHLEL